MADVVLRKAVAESRLLALEEENARLQAVAEKVLAARDAAMLFNATVKMPDKVWVAIVMAALSALDGMDSLSDVKP